MIFCQFFLITLNNLNIYAHIPNMGKIIDECGWIIAKSQKSERAGSFCWAEPNDPVPWKEHTS